MASGQELVVAKDAAQESESSAFRSQLLHLVHQLKGKVRSNSKKNAKCLLDLPLDVILEIFDHLHPIHSVCLGLTCKALYPIHWSIHQKVPLRTTIVDAVWARWAAPFSNSRKKVLAGLLIEWAHPLIWSIEEDKKDGKYYYKNSFFMTKKRHRELRAQGNRRFRFRV